ncbi:MAG: EAL domain-containing protein, partial [Gammaproteobacteria bacterium]|nr:EAL domain-containing protein [Gammaproteobacteria bacterium]
AWEAEHDQLSGLFNRRGLFSVLDPQFLQEPLALVLLDFDNFKLINDSLGHAAGDQFLTEVSNRLRPFASAEEAIARLGGDEFVLVWQAKSAADIESRLQQVKTQVENSMMLAGREISLRASIGVSLSGERSVAADQLLREADMAMYKVKHGTRKGGIEFFSQEMQQQAEKRLRAGSELKRALDEGQMVYHYQPIHALRGGEIIGLEALLRWRQVDGSIKAPDDFMSDAAEQGLLPRLGSYALEKGLSEFSDLCMQLQRYDWHLSINLTSHDLQNEQLASTVSEQLQRNGLQPHNLQIEITEQFLLEGDELSKRNIERLRDEGVRFAIDDFGTGYSALGYLPKMPVDCLKIDRSFVSDLEHDEVAQEVIHAVVRVAHATGHEVVAEGVETTAQANKLGSLGCDFGQGYMYSQPLPFQQLQQHMQQLASHPPFSPELEMLQRGYHADRLFDLAQDLLSIVGADGYFKRLNYRWQEVMGYEIGDMLAIPYMEYVHPEDYESSMNIVASVSAGHSMDGFVNRVRHKSGHYIELRWKAVFDKELGLIYASAQLV